MSLPWINDFLMKRGSERSNAYIFETLDPERITQFCGFALGEDVKEKLKIGNLQVLVFDLQRRKITELPGNIERQPKMSQSPFDFLDSLLSSSSTFIIMKWVLEPRDADGVTPFLISISQDDKIYRYESTVAVFTGSASLFSDVVRRFCCPISIPPSTPEEARKRLEKLANDLKDKPTLNVEVTDDVVEATKGLTLHDIGTAGIESIFLNKKFSVETFTAYKMNILKQHNIVYVEPHHGFESVGGYDYLKEIIRQDFIKLLQKPELATKYGVTIPRGFCLYGPPGTGKTWFALALAKEVNLPMLKLAPADFLRGIVGETESQTRRLINIIESLSPVVVFIDEADQLMMRRGAAVVTDSGVRRGLQSALLDWLGDKARKAFIIAATNLVEEMDPAFMRPGRLDKTLLILQPNEAAREEILRIHTSVIRKVPLCKDVDLKILATATDAWSGAELENLVLSATKKAMRKDADCVCMKDFEEATKSVHPEIGPRKEEIKRMIAVIKNLENFDQDLLESSIKDVTGGEEERMSAFLKHVA